MHCSWTYAAALVAVASTVHGVALPNNSTGAGIPLNVTNSASIKQAASTVVYNMLKTYYNGNVSTGQEGIFPGYSWWLGGAVFGGMTDYWAATGDDSYTNEVGEGLWSQAAPTLDFNMPDQHYGMGNDDEGFWVLAAMSALEEGFPVPADAPANLWETLAYNTFNDYVRRWEGSNNTCNGGLRWQVYPSNTGYDYKNSIANGVFMQLAARMARYTGNTTYGDWAETTFSWLEGIGLVNTDTWLVADGAHIEDNCTDVDAGFWSYNAAIPVYTAAVMYNITGQDTWHQRLTGLLNATLQHFFTPYSNATDIMFEAQCETANNCDQDQLSFKAYMSRWLSKTVLILPQFAAQVQPYLFASATAAAQACSGFGNHTCGTKWYVGGFDGQFGLGQYQTAYETFQSLLVFTGDTPLPGTAPGVSWS